MTGITRKVTVLPGDGIGPEVMAASLQVLEGVSKKYGHTFEYIESAIGGAAFDQHGEHFPESTRQACSEGDAILLGSIGGPNEERHLPKWDGCEAKALLGLRKAFQFYANLRPATVLPFLTHLSPLKPEILSEGVDMLIIRELLGDIYFGKHETTEENGEAVARDECVYRRHEIERIAHFAFGAASKRQGRLASVDKANVLDSSKLWRQVVSEIANSYPSVEVEHIFVDNAAMQLVKRPGDFDVVLCPNMFGDILSDLASVLPGSLGLIPSASINVDGFGLYEPAGGSAPELTGLGVANPSAQILSAAMMLRHSFGLATEADDIEKSVFKVMRDGVLTRDLTEESKAVTTAEFVDKVLQALG